METVAATAGSIEDDPVISEVDVYLSQSLSRHLYLLQYPLRPAHLPYASSDVLAAQVRPHQQQVEVELAVQPRGENYSTSRGEHYGKMVELSKPVNVVAEPYYRSGLMDKQTLSSDPIPLSTSRYVTAVFKDGELHVTPLRGLVQLRPRLSHLDQADVGSKKIGGGGTSEGEGTESEGEEAKPVLVKFARPTSSSNTTDTGRRKSFNQHKQQLLDESWIPLTHHGVQSDEATKERRLLFASEEEEDQSGAFSLSQEAYLDLVCPVERTEESSVPPAPSGVVSLSQLKGMPIPQQVQELLKNAQVIQFHRLCSLLGGRSRASALREEVQKCGVLVQGCWVVSSDVVYAGEAVRGLRNARDYILWCFTQNRIILRKDIAAITKIPHEGLREILHSVATQRVAQGWEFKLPTDHEFISNNLPLVEHQNEKWAKRYKGLVRELGIPKELMKHSQQQQQQHLPLAKHQSKPGQGNEPSGAKGLRDEDTKTPARPRKPSSTRTGLPPTEGEITGNSSEEECFSPHATPLSPHPETTQQQTFPSTVKQEPPTTELLIALGDFCRHALGRGVLGFPELKDKLLLYQAGASVQDPLRVYGVSDNSLESALQAVGAVEVGQASQGRRLFAMECTGDRNDQYRSVVLKLFQTHRSLRRKQILEEIGRQSDIMGPPDAKAISSVLKELCYSKGSQWCLQGT